MSDLVHATSPSDAAPNGQLGLDTPGLVSRTVSLCDDDQVEIVTTWDLTVEGCPLVQPSPGFPTITKAINTQRMHRDEWAHIVAPAPKDDGKA